MLQNPYASIFAPKKNFFPDQNFSKFKNFRKNLKFFRKENFVIWTHPDNFKTSHEPPRPPFSIFARRLKIWTRNPKISKRAKKFSGPPKSGLCVFLRHFIEFWPPQTSRLYSVRHFRESLNPSYKFFNVSLLEIARPEAPKLAHG